MRPLPRLALAILLLLPTNLAAQEVQRYRQWMDGTETGGMQIVHTASPTSERMEHREWTQLARLGTTIRQEIRETATRTSDGSLHLTWQVQLSSEPMLGEATWSPKEPGHLHVTVQGAKPSTLVVPPGGLLWPGDAETLLKQAAADRQPVRLTEFTGATQQWSHMDLQPIGPEPLPGFPEAVHFRGRGQEGAMAADLDLWISPKQGEVKQVAQMSGLTVLVQRAELPPPVAPPAGSGFFERTLAKLPPHPFLLWLPEATLRWNGPGSQELPQDDQQIKVGENRYRVKAAATPDAAEAAEGPVKGVPSKEDAPFLASSPLVNFQDPVFNGLIARMHPPENASRWELAKQVTTFVFDWITEKDMSVGFASAQEVARIPRGDCTEHGVLAVALLRKLGVPTRGVVGWVALGDVMGLHFWVEVKLRQRWVPVDPTFDQAPASAVRIKVATADLADLASIGWDTASLRFLDGTWVPESPWAEAIHAEGNTLEIPGGTILRIPGGQWHLEQGLLQLALSSRHGIEAITRPTPQQRAVSKLLLGATSQRRGWWNPGKRMLWVELGKGRWLQLDNMDESSAFHFLDLLEVRP
jgi:transglutaminase-like putative cysteine protease